MHQVSDGEGQTPTVGWTGRQLPDQPSGPRPPRFDTLSSVLAAGLEVLLHPGVWDVSAILPHHSPRRRGACPAAGQRADGIAAGLGRLSPLPERPSSSLWLSGSPRDGALDSSGRGANAGGQRRSGPTWLGWHAEHPDWVAAGVSRREYIIQRFGAPSGCEPRPSPGPRASQLPYLAVLCFPQVSVRALCTEYLPWLRCHGARLGPWSVLTSSSRTWRISKTPPLRPGYPETRDFSPPSTVRSRRLRPPLLRIYPASQRGQRRRDGEEAARPAQSAPLEANAEHRRPTRLARLGHWSRWSLGSLIPRFPTRPGLPAKHCRLASRSRCPPQAPIYQHLARLGTARPLNGSCGRPLGAREPEERSERRGPPPPAVGGSGPPPFRPNHAPSCRRGALRPPRDVCRELDVQH